MLVTALRSNLTSSHSVRLMPCTMLPSMVLQYLQSLLRERGRDFTPDPTRHGCAAGFERKVRVATGIEGSATAGRESGLHQLFGEKAINSRHGASLHRRRTRFFSMSPRGEIAFPMPLNKGNAPGAVKCPKRAPSCWSIVRRSCSTHQATKACLTQFYGLVAVLWIQ